MTQTNLNPTYTAAREALRLAKVSLPPEAIMRLVAAAQRRADKRGVVAELAKSGFTVGPGGGHALDRDVLAAAWPVVWGVVVGAHE